jgi:hypothetical protein
MSAERVEIPQDEAERRRLQIEKNQPMLKLVDQWLASNSDEDEEVFQKLKRVLEESHSPRRRLFYEEDDPSLASGSANSSSLKETASSNG